MVIIKDNYDNKFEIVLKKNNFYEFFGLVYVHINKIDPFIGFDNILLSFTKNNIIYTLEHNLKSKEIYDPIIEEYNITIIEKNKSFKYYYNNNARKILVNEITNIKDTIIKLCKKEIVDDGNYIIILEDFITENIYYKCYLKAILYEYWDENDKEFVYKITYKIYNNKFYDSNSYFYNYNSYIYDYKNNFNNIIYNLKVISV